MTARTYSTRRYAIVDALVSLFKRIDGTGTYLSNLNNNVFNKLKFYDEVTDFPTICVTASNESRQYQAGGYRDRYLEVRLMVFVNEDNPLKKCEAILEDVETLVEDNGRLAYVDRQGQTQFTHDITILSISTDEGTLDPISIGEMTLRVHY
jgi:hypothetical protein